MAEKPSGYVYTRGGNVSRLGGTKPQVEGNHPEAQISEEERKAAMKRLAKAKAANLKSRPDKV